MKNVSTILAVMLLCYTASHACVGSTHNPFCGSNFHAETSADEEASATIEIEEANPFASLAASSMLVVRDNTHVDIKFGFFKFFVKALKTVAKWGGVVINSWVNAKINQRARTYDQRYYSNANVRKAATHWDDMLDRSTSCPSRRNGEPDHMPRVAGWQGADECPICSVQLQDLRS